MGAYAEQLVYGLLLLLILSILANLHFVSRGLQKKMGARALQKKLPDLIKKFLNDQAQNTENARRHNQRSHLSKGVIKLRHAYLSIESRAIDKKIDSQDYWNLINTNVQKLLDILTEQRTNQPLKDIENKINNIKEKINSSGKSQSKKAVLASLDKFHQACIEHSKNPEKLAHYNVKLESLLDKISSASYRKITEKTKLHNDYVNENQKTLNTLKEHVGMSNETANNLANINPDDFDFSMDAFNKNQDSIMQSVQKYEDNLEKIKHGHNHANTTIITSSHHEINSTNGELDALSEQIQQENEIEIERLRDVIKGQKDIIIALEDNIDTLEGQDSKKAPGHDDERESNPHQVDITSLKNNLRESELCIDTLEGELNNLRQQQQQHKINPKSEPVTTPLTESNLSSLESTISQLKNEISEAKDTQDFHKSIMNFISESLDASSAEDISLSIYQTLEDLGWKAGLIINSGARTMEIDPTGLLKEREKTLIKNMHIGEVNSQKNGLSMEFHYVNIAGKVISEEHNSNADKNASILNLLQAADKIIGKMKSSQLLKNQKKALQDSANNIKKLAHEVDSTIETLNKRTQASVSSGFGQIQDIARSKGLKASQIASFKNLEQQTLNELAADNTLRLKVKKQFLLVLKSLDDF
ncbi:hypothetical protein [Marinagarivorans algicola]|uniref:hypothetical protein n=1 Tax=Marinagarivorans algicola TaxID=1513270 RepID=UPI0006B574BA|nr:hypothetical protein [Marinagarivorans algicola]